MVADARDVLAPGGAQRPQSLMLTFFGIHVLGQPIAVYSGSVIEIFARAGVSEDAVRSTLSRMVQRDLLQRHRRGRKTYFGLSPYAVEVLQDGHRRIWEAGAMNRDWDGQWTVVAFSLPDARRDERHVLRSRLLWAGFGPLQGGLWVAPGERDVAAVVGPLGLEDDVTALGCHAIAPTDAQSIVHRVFDIDELAQRYTGFLHRWDRERPGEKGFDPLARQLLLQTDWLGLVRADPLLPAQLLPADWPAVRAEEQFRKLAETYEKPAREVWAGLADAITLD